MLLTSIDCRSLSIFACPMVLGAMSDRMQSGFPPSNLSTSSAIAENFCAADWLCCKFSSCVNSWDASSCVNSWDGFSRFCCKVIICLFFSKGSISFWSIPSILALGAAADATCSQLPGAAPRSRIRFFSLQMRYFSSISISLNAARLRYGFS